MVKGVLVDVGVDSSEKDNDDVRGRQKIFFIVAAWGLPKVLRGRTCKAEERGIF